MNNEEKARIVTAVKESVQGKKYSELTKRELEVLFDGHTAVGTVCQHNKIINDSGLPWDTFINHKEGK